MFYLNLRSLSQVTVFLHDRDDFVLTGTRFLGMESIVINPEEEEERVMILSMA